MNAGDIHGNNKEMRENYGGVETEKNVKMKMDRNSI